MSHYAGEYGNIFYSVLITMCDGPGWGLVSNQASLTGPLPGAGEKSLSVAYLEMINVLQEYNNYF